MYAGFLYKKTYRYDIPEILLKVALNTINQTEPGYADLALGQIDLQTFLVTGDTRGNLLIFTTEPRRQGIFCFDRKKCSKAGDIHIKPSC
jgi:hypothetical protein